MNDAEEQVILVDAAGRPTGTCAKLAAHADGGQRHLAFSVLVFDADGQLLLQRRATGKYHFGGLWTNTCCGHPRPGETVLDAAERRLGEEFGFTVPLRERTVFDYRATDAASGLTEDEHLHVFTGRGAVLPKPDPAEIEAWRWLDLEELDREVATAPETFTPWFRLILQRLVRRGDR